MNRKMKNFEMALKSLEEAIKEPIRTNRDMAGIIQNFEFTYELGWKSLQEHLKNEGISVNTPKDSFKKAYQTKLIEDETLWIKIINDRNLSVHTYDRKLAKLISDNVKNLYFKEFKALFNKLKKKT